MLLYAITQRSLFPGDENARARALRAQARKLAAKGVDYLQIREKDMPLPALRSLAASIVAAVRAENPGMKILLNGPASIAVETGCDGIHLTSSASAAQASLARRLFHEAARPCTISAACHAISEVEKHGDYADILLYAPVFEKLAPARRIAGAGLPALSQAVMHAHSLPVLALGGVSGHNAPQCIQAGAAGIAAIRLFAADGWESLIEA